ncbi:hypothetical protein ACFQS6_07865 [Xanthomonas populi]|uniref:hypothetical protein n=1 Tax=Xanthomonas populi TaxID=53414 RepID=UPI001FC902B3|nr:hypothetical protein [Xanthomonas populi]
MIGRVGIGAVTMKIINNTNMASTSGVTLVCGSCPRLPVVLKAMTAYGAVTVGVARSRIHLARHDGRAGRQQANTARPPSQSIAL